MNVPKHEQNVQGGEPNINRECPDVTHRQVARRDHQKKCGGLFSRPHRLCLTAPTEGFAAFTKRCSVKDGTFELQLSREDIPMEIRRHQWSSLNVPLFVGSS